MGYDIVDLKAVTILSHNHPQIHILTDICKCF